MNAGNHGKKKMPTQPKPKPQPLILVGTPKEFEQTLQELKEKLTPDVANKLFDRILDGIKEVGK